MSTHLTEMTTEQCWEFLHHNQQHYGRIALSIGAEVDIYPVSYVIADGKIFFRTSEQVKFASVTISRKAAFEVDEVVDGVARCVVVKGTASWISPEGAAERADIAQLATDASGAATNWVEIAPERVRGSQFAVVSH